ncbi:hypothetical protein AgCh_010460 [Apium graveolens]
MVDQQKMIKCLSAQFNKSMLQAVKGEINGIDDSYPSSGMTPDAHYTWNWTLVDVYKCTPGEGKAAQKEGKNADRESGPEIQPNPTIEESTNSTKTKLKKSCQSNKHIKPKAAAIPPALRNMGRRQIFNAIMCWILSIVGTLFLLMVLSDSSYGTVKHCNKGDSFSGEHRLPILSYLPSIRNESDSSQIFSLNHHIGIHRTLEKEEEKVEEEILVEKEEEALVVMDEPEANTKTLMNYSQPKINDIQSSIVRPAIAANTFEIKASTIQMV